ncbi:MAG TPA: hypothetical protein VL147_21165 [Devosia sp.]|nr:hypothetical protein [Devosia sp.]
MPVAFPSDIFVASDSLAIDLGISVSRSEGGLNITSRRSDPFWRGRITTPPLPAWADDNVRAGFVAWLNWAVDLNMRIDFVHPKYQLPGHYTEDTWPMAGNAVLLAVPDLRTIVVSDLVVGMVLKRRDRISITQGDIVVHRWIGEDVVVSSAIAQQLVLTPRLPIGVLAAGAQVVLQNPVMRFVILPGSWEGEDALEPMPVSFEVSEALR